MAIRGGNVTVMICGCLLMALLCKPLLFVAGSAGRSLGASSLRGATIDKGVAYEPFLERPAMADAQSVASFLQPCLACLAAVALGLCVGFAAPQASHARGQALQSLGVKPLPGAMTWQERMEIELATSGKAQDEAKLVENKVKLAELTDPKEKRVDDAMQLMRAIAPKELHPSKELPAYNQSFM
eukprot:TRINITY_DN6472_c0_g1_i1.p1 TRINITY_DN6472_c0_g1~~TRINITY_DN6472_c0_g1_i1.p1  ORF type:complete len:184 (+),score=47.79 TRINITY_DN6472_c0_g1_i1:106-657(+)